MEIDGGVAGMHLHAGAYIVTSGKSVVTIPACIQGNVALWIKTICIQEYPSHPDFYKIEDAGAEIVVSSGKQVNLALRSHFTNIMT